MIKMDYFAEEWKNSATKICRFKFYSTFVETITNL